MSNQIQLLKGFRDFSATEMQLRKEIIGKITEVFEIYGFSELQTPALEYSETLLGKYGADAEKLMYLFKDPGDREVGLKYDLTVPLARYVSNNQDLPLPFKRYQIQPVWRAENTQKGRYREFYQCDIDIVGVKTPISDAEIVTVISECLKSVNLSDFTIQINSRTVLFQIMEKAGLEKSQWLTAIRSIDKLDKKSVDEVKDELSQKGFNSNSISEIFSSLNTAKPDDYLNKVIEIAKKMGAKNMVFNPSISRGLDYYDGPIFETVVNEPKIGSVTGGGRYDNLLKNLGGPDLPAVGSTLGLERIIDVITELNLLKDIRPGGTKVLVTVFDESLSENSITTANYLRTKKINTEIYLESAKLEKQLKYANKKQIPFVVVIGPEEAKENKIKIKNMEKGSEVTVDLENSTHELI